MFKLEINGKVHQVDVPGDVPLLWVLRDEADLKGTKFGCGLALCGACTVHVNGIPRRSCVVPLRDVAGQKVTTIEGIGTEEKPHPVQKAWLEENVPQCGYCQSGQIMSAVALLRANKNPTGEDVDAAMSGNICRCGTYPRIKRAILKAAKQGGGQ